MVGLGFLTGDHYSYANGVSADGNVVVGESYGSRSRAFRWTSQGMANLGFLPGATESSAKAVSPDGSVVVGSSGTSAGRQAFRWNVSGRVMVALGLLSGDINSYAMQYQRMVPQSLARVIQDPPTSRAHLSGIRPSECEV